MDTDLESIQDRELILNAIQNGNVEEAIERVNDLNPEVIFCKGLSVNADHD